MRLRQVTRYAEIDVDGRDWFPKGWLVLVGLEIVMRNVMEALDDDIVRGGVRCFRFWSGDKSKDTGVSGEFGEYGCERIWNTHHFGCKGKYSHDSAVFSGDGATADIGLRHCQELERQVEFCLCYRQ